MNPVYQELRSGGLEEHRSIAAHTNSLGPIRQLPKLLSESHGSLFRGHDHLRIKQCRRMAWEGTGLRQIVRVMQCSPTKVKKVLEWERDHE